MMIHMPLGQGGSQPAHQRATAAIRKQGAAPFAFAHVQPIQLRVELIGEVAPQRLAPGNGDGGADQRLPVLCDEVLPRVAHSRLRRHARAPNRRGAAHERTPLAVDASPPLWRQARSSGSIPASAMIRSNSSRFSPQLGAALARQSSSSRRRSIVPRGSGSDACATLTVSGTPAADSADAISTASRFA